VLRASSHSGFLRVEWSGLAKSNVDILDPLAPLIPELLDYKKEAVSADLLSEMYFDVKSAHGKHSVRFKLRAESSGLWRKLRAANESLLTPDEAAAVRFLLGRASGRVEVITDYPTKDGRVRQIGRRVYYSSIVDPKEFTSNLRTTEVRHSRNAYLPQSALLHLEEFRSSRRGELEEFLGGLGEWCYFFAP